MPLIETSCRNCHSERTVRPWYSYLPGVGRRLEKDVAEARTHMNLSRRDRYSIDEKKDQLTRIAAEVRSRQMPPARYTILHPRARLSDIEIQTIYDWTMIQRRNLRSQGIKQSPQESILMPQ